MGQEDWSEAIKVYSKLLNSVRNESRNNHYNEIGCLHALAVANYELKKWQEVIELAGEALAIDISQTVAERKKKDIDHLKKLRSKALRNMNNSG